MAFGVKTNERPGTRAQVRWARVSAYKAREVLDLIRGQSYARASEILDFTDRAVAQVVKKVLDSAVANAEHNDSIPAEELYVSACFADEGPTLKRFRPRARGRATRVRKRTCHITVIVTRYTPAELADLRARDAASGRGAGRTTTAAVADARRRRVQRSRELAATRAAAEEEHDHDHDHEGHDHDHDHDHEGHDHDHDHDEVDGAEDIAAETESDDEVLDDVAAGAAAEDAVEGGASDAPDDAADDETEEGKA
jgi:large subunit ribosomal protein L22